MMACVMLHNIIVKNEQDDDEESNDDVDESMNSRKARIYEHSIEDFELMVNCVLKINLGGGSR